MVLISMLWAIGAKAQSFSFSDLFGQANKQKNYYMQQIAAYNAFESELKQGYGVIKNGLNGIKAINIAELNAHSAYYQSLKQPGTVVKNNTQVQDILTWQADIVNSFNQPVAGLTTDEQSYISTVQANLLNGCNTDLTDLQNLLASNNLQMSDSERLQRLAKIHADMLDKYKFSQSFRNSVKLLAAQLQQGTNESQTLQSLYEKN